MRINARQTRKRYGDVSDVALWMWIKSDQINFPKPVFINGQRFFSVAELDAYDRRRIDELKQVLADGGPVNSTGWRAWEIRQAIAEMADA
jgi:predicted DNA-binding transcriptional regulator AlpA